MNKNNFMKAMSMIDEELLHEADTPYTPEAAEDTSNELYRENEISDSVTGVDVYHGFLWKKVLAVAATFVIAAGAVGGGAYYYSKLKENNNNNNNNMIEKDVEHESVTQTSTETQTTTTQTTTNEHITITQTYADTETTVQDTTPLSNIVRFESIKLPDDIKHLIKSKRTSDGFSGIVYYGEGRDTAYMHISEDMQTIEISVLTTPENQGDYTLVRQWFALEENEIWAITLMEDHGGLKPYDPQTDDWESYDFDAWGAAKQGEKYLLCHYAEDGTLLSAIPANDLQNYPFDYRIDESFDCVGDVLYMTLSDDRIVQIDKETADVTVVSELHKEDYSYNYINLCFDRDDKPILLQTKEKLAPDVSPIVYEAVISEFDLASRSCGQTIYATGDDFNETHYFEVLKGSGEYRLFVNTGSKLLGIRDNGTQELLIDIDASDLFNTLDLPIKYASTAGHDMQIVPIDDIHFLEIHNNYSTEPPKAFRLTRKHESELN